MEMLGVFALVYIGGWACVMESISYGSVLSVAFAHMFVLSVMIWVGAATSGAHYNPAVTIALMITGHHTWLNSIFYIVFQIAGSFLGALLLHFLIPVEFQDKVQNNK